MRRPRRRSFVSGSTSKGPDIAVAPADGDTARRGLKAVLAGRFRWARKAVVDEVVKRHAGEVIEDFAESHVRPFGSKR
jgi:hypothetical protein